MIRLFISLVLLALSATLAWGQPGPPRDACNVLQARWASSWPNSSRSRSLDENRQYSSGYRVGSPIEVDGGHPTNWHALRFKLVNQPSPISFYLNEVSGQIQTYSERFDHEQRSSYPLSVEAWLQGGPKHRKNPSGAQKYCNERFTQGCGDCRLQTITVNVSISDEPERPPRPRAPRVTGVHGSLTASWDLVEINPQIRSYDTRYRIGLKPFRNGPQGVIGTSATIENLDPHFNYQVSMRATNALGDSPWSATTPARTTPAPPPPIPPPPPPSPPAPDPDPDPDPPDPDPPAPPPPSPAPRPNPDPPEPDPAPHEEEPVETVYLDFPHFGNGAGIISDLVLVNTADYSVSFAIRFSGKDGNLIDPASVVDLPGYLEITEDGDLAGQLGMEPYFWLTPTMGELTISTHGRGEIVSGSVQVSADGPIGGVVRFHLPGIGVAGVGASQPMTTGVFPARRQGGLSTAVAVHNIDLDLGIGPDVVCRLMKEGEVLEEIEFFLKPNGQDAQFIEEMFPRTDTSDFVGSVRCSAKTWIGGIARRGMFTAIAVELDAGNQIFTTVPVVPIQRY